MRTFFALILILIILASLGILGNMLRCTSITNQVCPGWCLIKQVKCLADDCEVKSVCRPPELLGYVSLIDEWLSEQKQSLFKK